MVRSQSAQQSQRELTWSRIPKSGIRFSTWATSRPDGRQRQQQRLTVRDAWLKIVECRKGKASGLPFLPAVAAASALLKKQACSGGFHVDAHRVRHPDGGCLRGLRFLAGQCPTAAAPAIAASLCSRLRHHYASERRQLRLEAERSGGTPNGHALLPY